MNEERNRYLKEMNAFIDGELDVEARARVTSRAGRDPAYARQLAALGRVKAAASQTVPTPTVDLPPRPGRGGWRRAAMAAAACSLLFVAAGIGWFAARNTPGAGPEISLAWSIEAHRGWKAQPSARTSARLRPASAVPHPVVPDLSSNGLDLAYAGTRSTPGGNDVLVVGYLGSRGCRLTMLVQRSAGTPPTDPVSLETGSLLASIWQTGELRYALLAEGMAQPRFHLIAGTVRRTTIERLPIDQSTRVALAQNRASSRACQA